MRSCLKVSGTHLKRELSGVVGPARSQTLAACRCHVSVLGLRHLDSLHIVLVSTSFEQDTSLGEFVFESVSVIV